MNYHWSLIQVVTTKSLITVTIIMSLTIWSHQYIADHSADASTDSRHVLMLTVLCSLVLFVVTVYSCKSYYSRTTSRIETRIIKQESKARQQKSQFSTQAQKPLRMVNLTQADFEWHMHTFEDQCDM